MTEFTEQNIDIENTKTPPKTVAQLRAEYVLEMGENGKPRGHIMNMMIGDTKAETVAEISSPFKKAQTIGTEVIAGSICTNPSAPVEMAGEEGIEHTYARKEGRYKEDDSEVVICERILPDGDDWRQDMEMPTFPKMQDPFHCGLVDGYQIFGGVEINKKADGEMEWRTVLYRYKESLKELKEPTEDLAKPFCVGPMGMKDIRVKQLSENRIAVFTRPQGEFGGRGQVGYFEISNLSELEPALQKHVEENDPKSLIEGMFQDKEWGGVNELHNLKDGRIGVIGHIARVNEDKSSPRYGVKDYYATAFIFDPATRSLSDLKIIATAEDFPEVQGKKADIGSVVFSGGIKRLGNGKAIFYCGVRDVEAGYLQIEDPFGDL